MGMGEQSYLVNALDDFSVIATSSLFTLSRACLSVVKAKTGKGARPSWV